MSNSIKFDWNDISIVPATLSDISSRKEVNPTYNNILPLFTAPMDTVIDSTNAQLFSNSGLNICLPRHVKYEEVENDNYFYSYGLDEVIELLNKKSKLPKRILIDVAQGHMKKLYDTSKYIKETFGNSIELMVGNIANPLTYAKYCDIGVDYIRVGIGGGSACTTSANVAIHYPMASLINECSKYKSQFTNPTKIIADGGFRNFSDIIKALALGADFVMIGGILNKSLESCGETFMKDNNSQYYPVDSQKALHAFTAGVEVYKYYRGMSTKEVQKSWNKSELKTGEGITKYNKVEYTLQGWCENFTDYLKSAMSYCGCRTLEEYCGKVEFINITGNAFSRFNK